MEMSTMGKPSLTLRIGVGMAVGFLFGVIGFLFLPSFAPDATWQIRWGILLWYTTLGAIIGMVGVYTKQPLTQLPLPWWFRASFVGAWMNFILTFFAYEEFRAMLMAFFGADADPLTSPFWFTLEGAIVGLVIGGIATRFGGEGPETAGH